MKTGRVSFRVLLDAGVPDSVGRAFAEGGHAVLYHRDVLPEATPDQVVAATAILNRAILVAIDHDMNQIAHRYGTARRDDRFDALSLISIRCNETVAAKRLSHVMSLVEHEWRVSQDKAARRMWIEVATHFVRSNR